MENYAAVETPVAVQAVPVPVTTYEPVSPYQEEKDTGWSTGAIIGTGIAGAVIGGAIGYWFASSAAEDAATETRLNSREELRKRLEEISSRAR